MLLTILFFVITVIGFVVFFLCYNSYFDLEILYGVSLIVAIISLCCFLTCGTLALLVQIPSENDYLKAAEEREMLVYRLETIGEDSYGKEILHQDILEFNKDLMTCKRYANNPWLNWFYNQEIAKLDYIDYKK